MRRALVVGVAVLLAGARIAAADTCKDEERDLRGDCPKAKAPPPRPKTPARPPTQPSPPASKKRSCPEGMVHVEGGTFTMGDAQAVPQHQVTLSGYCIDKTEVTVAAYARCAAAGGCAAAPTPYDRCNGNKSDRQDHPMNCIDWNEAQAYCAWAKKRLPTEAEWEYAARGKDGRTYPWGNDAPTSTRLNWNNEHKGTTPVGSFPDGASPFGALDMAGNVWEWTADGYGPYKAEAATNPTGDASSSYRVVRGGGWNGTVASHVRAAYRFRNGPGNRNLNLGVRCARGD